MYQLARMFDSFSSSFTSIPCLTNSHIIMLLGIVTMLFRMVIYSVSVQVHYNHLRFHPHLLSVSRNKGL